MAKELVAKIKLQCPGGQATPAPPVGPALGAHGIQPGDFVKKFNDATKDQQGTIIPVVVSVYKDRTYDFVLKTPPAATLLKKAANIAKGSGVPNKEKVGAVSMEQVREIAQLKMKDLNAASLEAAVKIVAGTARSMGIEVSESGKPAAPPAPPAAPGTN
jgi:large subunit ribosomal protein L11